MAKRKVETDEVEVVAVAGFKHNDEYVFAGDELRLSTFDAGEMLALNMVRLARLKEMSDG
jgi:hypothetical protein